MPKNINNNAFFRNWIFAVGANYEYQPRLSKWFSESQKHKFQGHIPEILRTNFENNMCKYVLKNLCSFCGVDKKIAPLNNEQTLENQINAKIKLFIAIGHSSNGHPKIKPKLTQGEVNTSIFR